MSTQYLSDSNLNLKADFYFDVDSIYYGDNDIEQLIKASGSACSYRFCSLVNRLKTNTSSRFTVDISNLTMDKNDPDVSKVKNQTDIDVFNKYVH